MCLIFHYKKKPFIGSLKDRGERFNDDKKDKEIAKIHYISGENSCIQTSPPAPPTTATVNSTHSNIIGNTNTTSTTTESTPAAIAPSENYSYVTLTAVSENSF